VPQAGVELTAATSLSLKPLSRLRILRQSAIAAVSAASSTASEAGVQTRTLQCWSLESDLHYPQVIDVQPPENHYGSIDSHDHGPNKVMFPKMMGTREIKV
jgi:hypothetical protein